MEAASTAAMLCVAVAFEHIYHHLLHLAEHSFLYGQAMLSHEDKHACLERAIFTKPLRLILYARMGGEFMVLGFLAFTIWACNQSGVFDALAVVRVAGLRLPTTGSDYLHKLEEVHMQLFVAMILYFALCLVIVLSADARIKEFEYCRGAWVEQLQHGHANDLENDPARLRAFKYWRGHFLTGALKEIYKWKNLETAAFKEIMHSMKMDKDIGSIDHKDLEEVFTNRFSFCSYLVFSLCSATMYIVNMSDKTILSIVIVKLLMALLHRFGKQELSNISPILCGLCFLFLLLIYYITAIFKKSLAHKTVQPIRGLSWLPEVVETVSARCDPSRLIISIMQILMFFLCHAWSGYLISNAYWAAIFTEGDTGKLGSALFYVSSLIGLAWIIPRIVPDFAVVMSLPPFFSRGNKRMIKLVAIQVVDSKMVAARAALKHKLEAKKREDEAAHMPAPSGPYIDPDSLVGAKQLQALKDQDAAEQDGSMCAALSIVDVTDAAEEKKLMPGKAASAKPEAKKKTKAKKNKENGSSGSKNGRRDSADSSSRE